MKAQDAIRTALTSTQNMLGMYLGDLSDADLLVRPVPGANHIAWQLGHLTATEARMGASLPGAAYPELPAGFADRHNKDTAAKDTGFASKAEYLGLFNKVPPGDDRRRRQTIRRRPGQADGRPDRPARAHTRGAADAQRHPRHDARRPVQRRPTQAGQAGPVLRRAKVSPRRTRREDKGMTKAV